MSDFDVSVVVYDLYMSDFGVCVVVYDLCSSEFDLCVDAYLLQKECLRVQGVLFQDISNIKIHYLFIEAYEFVHNNPKNEHFFILYEIGLPAKNMRINSLFLLA